MTRHSPLYLSKASLLTCTALALGGCSSSSSSDTPTPTPEAGSITEGGLVGSATGCPNSVIGILFNPMYSAYDGMHKFQIPAIVNGISASAITWSASDPTMVALETDPASGGVMITTQKAGTVSIIAQAGSICGSSPLTITDATPDQWDIGSQRYNNGSVVTAGRGGGVRVNEASTDAKCTNCHGDLANGPYKTVAHTPEQTGGFSDDQLLSIFRHGNVPDGGYFDTAIVSYAVWQSFHQWSMTDDEAKGVIVYLRSLTPQMQTGQPNFGRRGDGGPGGGFEGGAGFPEGGFGGGGRNRDAAAEAAPPPVDAGGGTALDAGVEAAPLPAAEDATADGAVTD